MAVCDLKATPRMTGRFRRKLLKYPWLEILIQLIHLNGRRPSSAEMFILDYIRSTIQVLVIYFLLSFFVTKSIFHYKLISYGFTHVRECHTFLNGIWYKANITELPSRHVSNLWEIACKGESLLFRL